jgi:hypothetical protein
MEFQRPTLPMVKRTQMAVNIQVLYIQFIFLNPDLPIKHSPLTQRLFQYCLQPYDWPNQ